MNLKVSVTSRHVGGCADHSTRNYSLVPNGDSGHIHTAPLEPEMGKVCPLYFQKDSQRRCENGLRSHGSPIVTDNAEASMPGC